MTERRRWGLEVIALLGLLLVLGGCDQSRVEEQQTKGPPLKQEDYPKLAAALFELAAAKEPDQYAERTGLTFNDGLVQVVIEVRGPEWVEDLKWAVEALGGRSEISHEASIQASVPIDALLKLAKHPRITYIRPPVRPRK